jgi:hypothetical protein
MNINMKYLAVTVCLLLPANVATALTPGDCTKIADSGDRLACFDKLFPSSTRAADPKRDLRDITIDENARLDKSLKSICRDCTK